MKNSIMKQRLVPGLGAFMDAMFTVMPLLSAVNFVSIIVILYTSVRPWLLAAAPWIDLWMFFALIIITSIIAMALVYKFVLPSLWTFRSKQMFQHQSDIDDKLDAIIERFNIEVKKK